MMQPPTPGFVVKLSFLELESETHACRPKLRRVYSDGVIQVINRITSHSHKPTSDVFNRQSMPKVTGPEEMPPWWLTKRYVRKSQEEKDSDASEICASTSAASCGSSTSSEEDHTSHLTTLRISNIPAEYNREFFAKTLDREGFAGFYDFLFVPMNFGTNLNSGIAIANFRSNATAAEALKLFESYDRWLVDSTQVAVPTWSEYEQGLQDLLERYKNSPLMHESVPDICKPATFNTLGEISTFPAATRRIRKPRNREWESRHCPNMA